MTKRIGMIDFDTSHAFEFAARLNHKGVEPDQWVDGGQVVVGCPGSSIIYPELVPRYTSQIREIGVPIVDSPERMLDYGLDAVLIESNCGAQHLQHVEFFARHKIPMFVDKPFACSLADAQQMVHIAKAADVPIMTSSSLRFAPELVAFCNKTIESGKTIVGAIAFGPGILHPQNPGLFNYGIHAVEMLYTLLGPGCESVASVSSKHADVTTAVWQDGRIGSLRTDRPGKGFGFVAFTDTIEHVNVSTRNIYRELLVAIIGMIESRQPPVPVEQSLEILAFIEQANDSSANHGIPRCVSTAPSPELA